MTSEHPTPCRKEKSIRYLPSFCVMYADGSYMADNLVEEDADRIVDAVNAKKNTQEAATEEEWSPAFPFFTSRDDGAIGQYGHGGMALKEYASIHLRVTHKDNPDWLNDMVRESRRLEFAGRLAPAYFAEMWSDGEREWDPPLCIEFALKRADGMLAEAERGAGCES